MCIPRAEQAAGIAGNKAKQALKQRKGPQEAHEALVSEWEEEKASRAAAGAHDHIVHIDALGRCHDPAGGDDVTPCRSAMVEFLLADEAEQDKFCAKRHCTKEQLEEWVKIEAREEAFRQKAAASQKEANAAAQQAAAERDARDSLMEKARLREQRLEADKAAKVAKKMQEQGDNGEAAEKDRRRKAAKEARALREAEPGSRAFLKVQIGADIAQTMQKVMNEHYIARQEAFEQLKLKYTHGRELSLEAEIASSLLKKHKTWFLQ